MSVITRVITRNVIFKANIHLLLLPGVGELEFQLRVGLFCDKVMCSFVVLKASCKESTDYFVLRKTDLLI